jgi:hypothetical protein
MQFVAMNLLPGFCTTPMLRLAILYPSRKVNTKLSIVIQVGSQSVTRFDLMSCLALLVLDTYLTATSLSDTIPRAFIYISAEDITRPFVPARYIETKREAEIAIQNRLRDSSSQIRPVFIRPSTLHRNACLAFFAHCRRSDVSCLCSASDQPSRSIARTIGKDSRESTTFSTHSRENNTRNWVFRLAKQGRLYPATRIGVPCKSS